MYNNYVWNLEDETGNRIRMTNKKTDNCNKKMSSDCCLNQGSRVGRIIHDGLRETEQKPALLLHSCCGPCSTSVIEQLASEYVVTVFFYNPCITDEEEYLRRRDTQKEFLKAYNEANPGADPIRFIEGKYQPMSFFRLAEGLENEPEGGARCTVCFEQRLEKTAEYAQMHGFDLFTTTLSVSPYKDHRKISEIGRKIALRHGISFLDRDFKKKDGYRRSVELSRAYGLYRQNYCGCRFSKRDNK